MVKITQKVVAEKAGVSQCTVSYVLNGLADNSIPEETIKKVLTAAEEMGYKKRSAHHRRVKNSTKNIACLLPVSTEENSEVRQYYSRFMSGIVPSAEKSNYYVIVYENYSYLMQAILSNLIDGLIIDANPDEIDLGYIRSCVPTVLLNCRAGRIPMDSVMPDNKKGIKKAVSRLYSLGHRRIALFGMKPMTIHTEERFEGYREGLREFGLKAIDEYIQIPMAEKKTVEEGDECALETLKYWLKLKNKPTAIVTFGDCYALSLIKAAGKMNLRLPEDLSITGFDNIISCRYSVPTLSSIEQPMEEMGKKALMLLSERMNNPGKLVENVTLDTELIERESICENREKS